MRSFTAIAEWVANVPADLLVRLYLKPAPGFPSKTTLWRVLTSVDAPAVDAAIGAWLLERARRATASGPPGNAAQDDQSARALLAVAVDGKTVRGATDAEGDQVHLMAAATHGDQLVLGQIEVGAKTNEIPMFAPLLDLLATTGVDLTQLVVTADAVHCHRAHATYLHERGAGFVFTAKQNQPGLFAALAALLWTEVPIAHREIDRGHGRVTTRTIQTLPAPPDLPFPHVNQVWLIERYVTGSAGSPTSAIAALGVTNLHADQAGPAELAALVRDHWGVESLHCAIPSTAKTTPEPAPAPDPGSWPPRETSPSEPCTWPAAATSPKPPAGPPAPCTDHSKSSDSIHDHRSWNARAYALRRTSAPLLG